jgi:hypothetical protein
MVAASTTISNRHRLGIDSTKPAATSAMRYPAGDRQHETRRDECDEVPEGPHEAPVRSQDVADEIQRQRGVGEIDELLAEHVDHGERGEQRKSAGQQQGPRQRAAQWPRQSATHRERRDGGDHEHQEADPDVAEVLPCVRTER